MNRCIGLILTAALALTACTPDARFGRARDATEQPATEQLNSGVVPVSTPDLPPYYKNIPPAATLIVGDQKQTAGVGAFTWTVEKKDEENQTLPPTYTPGPPTQYPAISAEQVETRVVELFKIEGACQPPCWGGITPGSTTWEEAAQILGRLGASFNTWDYPGGSAGHAMLPVPTLAVSQKIATSGQMSVTIYASEGIVQQIVIEGPANFPDYTLPGLLRRYGPPAEVLISTTNRPGSSIIPFFLILYYPEHGLLAKYLDLTEVKDDKLMGCFHYTPGPVLHFFPPQEDATFAQVYEAFTTGSADEYKPLQEVTALDVSKFTERLKDSDYPCVETPANFWRVR